MRQLLNRLRAHAGLSNLNETYTLFLLTVGIPAVFYAYIDWKAALTSFVLTQIILGFLRERS